MREYAIGLKDNGKKAQAYPLLAYHFEENQTDPIIK
jgi:hypothetical protein